MIYAVIPKYTKIFPTYDASMTQLSVTVWSPTQDRFCELVVKKLTSQASIGASLNPLSIEFCLIASSSSAHWLTGCLFRDNGDFIKIGSSCQYFLVGSVLSLSASSWFLLNSLANFGLRAPFLNFPSFHCKLTLPYDQSGTLPEIIKLLIQIISRIWFFEITY